jgi:hypothetical protein
MSFLETKQGDEWESWRLFARDQKSFKYQMTWRTASAKLHYEYRERFSKGCLNQISYKIANAQAGGIKTYRVAGAVMPTGVTLNAVQAPTATTYEQFLEYAAGNMGTWTNELDHSGDPDPLNGALNSGDTIRSHSSSAGNSIDAANEARYDDEPEAGMPIMRRVSADGWVVDEEILSDEYGNEIKSADASHVASFWAAGSPSDHVTAQILCLSCGIRTCKYEGNNITQCNECCVKERHLSQQRKISYVIQATHVLAICAAIYWGVKISMRRK